MLSIFEPSYDNLLILHQRFDLTLKSPRTTVKKGYLLKWYQDLVQSLSEISQIRLEIGLMSNIKQ